VEKKPVWAYCSSENQYRSSMQLTVFLLLLCCTRWKSEIAQLQQSLDSLNQEFDKQSRLLNRMQNLVTYQKSEITKLQASEDIHKSLALKTESLEVQLKVRVWDNISNSRQHSVCLIIHIEHLLCHWIAVFFLLQLSTYSGLKSTRSTRHLLC